jgi:quinol-cytochrome oxidoreductase complex cytochrome b subunit
VAAEPASVPATGASDRGALWRWLDERYDLAALERFARHKEVPVGEHSMIWYFLGGLTLFFFVVQILSGILLLMYYQAGESTSYESMRFIVTQVPFGWLVRAVHCWSAHLMILTLLFHMWSVFFLRAYRKPRELTWFTGIALFGLSLGFGFSGYLLPWNELAYFATAVGTDSVKAIPFIGDWMLRVMRGGDEVSIRTLYRFYALHVAVLPIATFAVVGIHLLFIQKQGMAEAIPEDEPERPRSTPVARPAVSGAPDIVPATRRGMPFVPNFALRDLLIWILAVNLLALLAVMLPYGPGIPGFEWELGLKADPLKPAYPGIKPEWYFLWMYQLLKEFPPHILGMEGPQACLALSTLLLAIWAFVPFLDRRAAENRPGPAFTDFGVGILYFLGFLMLKAWDVGAPPVAHGVDPTADPANAALVARTCATWLVGVAAAVTLLRAARWKHRYFWISALPVVHAVLHGYAGLTYLTAGTVAAALLAVVLGATWQRARALPAAVALLAGALLVAAPAAAQTAPSGSLPEASWPASFTRLLADEEVPEAARVEFRQLPKHAQELFFAAQRRGLLDHPAQLAALLAIDVADEHIELLVGDNCVLCHTNPDQQPEETLFRVPPAGESAGHLDLREVVADVHLRRGLSCSGCHGGKPTDEEMTDAIYDRWPDRDTRQADRSWIPSFCTEACHSQTGFMRRYNPSLPVDQMLKYRESRHGDAVLSRRNPSAAQCLSCHGVHGIRRPTSPQSLVFPANIPATCGRCHADPQAMRGVLLDDGKTPIPTDQLAQYAESVHGRALLERHDLGAPACNDCHGNHAAMPPAVASVSQICRNCHVNNGKLFDGSPHKAAFETMEWPECETCHGNHEIQKTSDAMLGTGPGNVCKSCHDEYGGPECNETAQHFHDQIVALDRLQAETLAAIEAAETQGLDLSDLRFEMENVHDVLVESRSKIHAFDRAEFDKTIKRGFTLVESSQTTITAALGEYGFRKVGLAISTLVVSLVALFLFLKIRDIERRQAVAEAAGETAREPDAP